MNHETFTPDEIALATLAAQSRFTSLHEDRAIAGALALLGKARERLDPERALATALGEEAEIKGGGSRPKKFPATFDDVLNHIVGGKDRKERLQKFSDFLTARVTALRDTNLSIAMNLSIASKRPAGRKPAGRKPLRSIDGCEVERPSVSAPSVIEIPVEVEKQLAEYQATKFSEQRWGEMRAEWKRYSEPLLAATRRAAGAKGLAARGRAPGR